MSFGNPQLLWVGLAGVLPAVALLLWWSWRTRRKLLTRLVGTRLMPGLLVGYSPWVWRLSAAFTLAALGALFLVLASPQAGFETQEMQQQGLDVLIAIDTSKSMLAPDLPPDRLRRAKLAILDLVRLGKSDRFGLVPFAGSSFLQTPLTVDDAAFAQSLDVVDVNTIPLGGSSIAEALDRAINSFDKESTGIRAVVIFSDGEDHEAAAVKLATRAARNKIRVFTVGVGTTEGELIPVKSPDGSTDFLKDLEGKVVKSRLNEAYLREVAEAGEGFYLPLKSPNPMETLYHKGLAVLPKSELGSMVMRMPRLRYHLPLAIAILLITLEYLLPCRGVLSRPRRSVGAKQLAALTLLLLALAPVGSLQAQSPIKAQKDFQRGNYAEALRDYEEALRKKGANPQLHYNAGVSAYRHGSLDTALKHFREATQSPDLTLQQQGYYNLGNTLFLKGEQEQAIPEKQKQWTSALEQFNAALKLNPNDSDAAHNREFVQRMLEQLKQQQQQQQQQQQKQDQKKDQKQQNKDDKSSSSENKQDQQQNSEENSDKKDNEGQNQPQEQNQKEENGEKSQQEQQKEQEKNGERGERKEEQQNQSGNEPSAEEQAAQAMAEAAMKEGKMTQQQAANLLEAHRAEEKPFPFEKANRTSRQRSFKDW
jgi:Ca-activated chloride channel family protein